MNGFSSRKLFTLIQIATSEDWHIILCEPRHSGHLSASAKITVVSLVQQTSQYDAFIVLMKHFLSWMGHKHQVSIGLIHILCSLSLALNEFWDVLDSSPWIIIECLFGLHGYIFGSSAFDEHLWAVDSGGAQWYRMVYWCVYDNSIFGEYYQISMCCTMQSWQDLEHRDCGQWV